MTIREQHNKGRVWYGHAEIRDFTLDKKYGGKIVETLKDGEYKNTCLTPAQIAMIRKEAEAYDIATGGNHDIKVTIYEKGEE